MRVATSGKLFSCGRSTFHFRAVECATRNPAALRHDFESATAAGFTVVTAPALPATAVGVAAETGLRVLLAGPSLRCEEVARVSRAERRRLTRSFAAELRRAVAPWRSGETLL